MVGTGTQFSSLNQIQPIHCKFPDSGEECKRDIISLSLYPLSKVEYERAGRRRRTANLTTLYPAKIAQEMAIHRRARNLLLRFFSSCDST